MKQKEKEQYERNRNIEINQLDWLPNENLKEVIQKVAHSFGLDNYRPEHIDAAHRIPNRNKEKPSTIIIQFKHREGRDAWVAQRKKVVTNDDIHKNGNGRRIYLNENMTPHYKELFWKTKMYAKEHNIKYVWFLRGKIMTRKQEGDKEVKIVRSEKDLN